MLVGPFNLITQKHDIFGLNGRKSAKKNSRFSEDFRISIENTCVEIYISIFFVKANPGGKPGGIFSSGVLWWVGVIGIFWTEIKNYRGNRAYVSKTPPSSGECSPSSPPYDATW